MCRVGPRDQSERHDRPENNAMSETQTKVRTGPATPAQRIDAVIVGAGFAGMYMLHRLRGLGLSARVFEAGQRRRRHLVLEPLSRRALRRREHGVLLLVLRRSSSRNGSGRSATPPSRRSCATPTTSPTGFDLRRDIQFDTRVTAAPFDEATQSLDGRDRPRRPGGGALMHHGDGLPVGRPGARLPGPRRPSGARPTTPATGRMRASISPASGSA